MERYLFHHGIRGQKWGVRNGPPYPLTDFSPKARARRRQERKLRDLTEEEYIPGMHFARSVGKSAIKDAFKKYEQIYEKFTKEWGNSVTNKEELKKFIRDELDPNKKRNNKDDDDDEE